MIDRRAAELEADRLGMAYVARAGYDPFAQVDFLQTLLASGALEAQLRGRDPELAPPPEQAEHPAVAERLRQARARAGRLGNPRGGRDRQAHLAAIDGLAWGDGPAQGFMRGRSFVHPDLRFAFDGPPGYGLANRPDVVAATGPCCCNSTYLVDLAWIHDHQDPRP